MTYKRVDNIVVGTGAEIAGNQARSGIWQTASGLYGDFTFWQGTTSFSALATAANSCIDWTGGTGFGLIGATVYGVGTIWNGAGSDFCTASGHERLLCIEQ